jgi:metal-responsive CopG/Arc/MetJ family transcriptional regulator
MPSNRPLIQLRLEQTLYDKLSAEAKAQGRSRSNFVENLVRKAMEPKSGQSRARRS